MQPIADLRRFAGRKAQNSLYTRRDVPVSMQPLEHLELSVLDRQSENVRVQVFVRVGKIALGPPVEKLHVAIRNDLSTAPA